MNLPELKIGNLTPKLPIVQGGMGVAISLAELASAVANEGGIGVIASIGIALNEPDVNNNTVEAYNRALRNEIRKAKSMTKGIIGVNIMVATSNYDDLVRVSIEENADIIISGAGLPLGLPRIRQERNSDIKLVPITSSGRGARVICRAWDVKFNVVPDAIIVEGPLAGGHLGYSNEELGKIPELKLEDIVQDVIEATQPYEQKHKKKIPIIGAGGIYTGADIVNLINLGASGVQMGTRFVATHECNADENFKQAYINAKKDDIVIIQSPLGLPGRAIRNKFIEKVENGKKVPVRCPYRCLKTCKVEESPYCIALALVNAARGNLDRGFVFCGANAYRVNKIVSTKELMNELEEEIKVALAHRTEMTERFRAPTSGNLCLDPISQNH